MHDFFKRFISLMSCFVFLIFSVVSIPASALTYVDKSSFKDFRFNGSSVPDTAYNYDYWFLVARPSGASGSQTTYYYFDLYLIADCSQENFGSTEGVLRFYTDTYPDGTKLYSVYQGNPGPATDYEQSVYYSSGYNSSPCNVSFKSSSNPFPASFINGFVFDNFNLDKFPVYDGASSRYTSKMILASNVDIYNQYGQLLQYGNYYTLLQYFNGALDASRIKDYSGHETAPGVVVEPTEPSSSGDSQTSKDQLETSKGIWGTVKDVFNKLVEIAGNLISLPFDIAVALGDILRDAFESLKNDILDGIKSLFVPSDNLFNDMRDLLEQKFKFINQIIELVFDFSDVVWKEEPPDSNVTIYGVTVSFMNWEFYDKYRNIINTITVIVSYYWFIKRLIRKTPKVIGGVN